MTDAETIADLRALLAEREAEIADLRERVDFSRPKTWTEARLLANHFELVAYKLQQKAGP